MSKKQEQRELFLDYYCGECEYDEEEAAKRIGVHPDAAATYGRHMLRDARVSEMLRERVRMQTENRKKTKEEFLSELWEAAFADVNDLVQVWVGCCRHCYGEGHAYQWSSAAELKAETDRAKALGIPEPDASGGFGYVAAKQPNMMCPECGGDGVKHVWMQSTAKLTGGARALYKGVKMTKFGPELILRDQDKAREMIGRVQGYFKDSIDLTLMQAPPLSEFYKDADGDNGDT